MQTAVAAVATPPRRLMQTAAVARGIAAAVKRRLLKRKQLWKVRVVLTTTNVNTAAPAAVAAFAVINERKESDGVNRRFFTVKNVRRRLYCSYG